MLEEQARHANRHGFNKHSPALPLYSEEAARRALDQFTRREFGEVFEPIPGFHVRLRRAGHILGSASVHPRCGEYSVLFSGDLGRTDDVMMLPPEHPEAADVVLIESTYGNRSHAGEDPAAQLADVVSRTAARGGIIVVPAFAVGRAQARLHIIHQLTTSRRIPDLPVFLNSPMAADVTLLLRQYAGEHHLSANACRALASGVHIVNSEDESRAPKQVFVTHGEPEAADALRQAIEERHRWV